MTKGPYDVMDLKALRCFWATAKQGSLTRAGIELGISEAAISQRLKALEGYLGTKLYESRGGRIRLTPAGERTMEMAIGLFDQLDQFESAISDEQAIGTITLSTYEPVLRYLLPDIAQQFSKDHPLAHLRLLSPALAETVKLVRMNEVDLGIVPERRLPKEVAFYSWKTYKSYLLLPKGHPLTRRGLPAIEDLLNESTLMRYPLTMPALEDTKDSRVADALRERGLPYNVGLEVGTIESVKNYVARGLGIGVVTGICLTDGDSNIFDIIEIPDELGGGTTYGVILRKDKHISAVLAGLLSIIGISVPQTASPSDPSNGND
jgi:DNA-binding transcriptional LysR family regulator